MRANDMIPASLLGLLSFQLFVSTTTTIASASSSASASYSANTARRERNLDHWDADTLAFYLGIDVKTGEPLVSPSSLTEDDEGDDIPVRQYAGHDAAVLFYAQWCNNCHRVAPYWDAIATHMNAGSVKSQLIMGLFDCEKDYQHMQLCTAAGVNSYPTMMFIGAGPYHDTDPLTAAIAGKDKSAGPMGATPLPHTVKFQGNWQYTDSIMDWIRTMQGLSTWHQWTTDGFLRHIRNGLLGVFFPKASKKKKSLNQSLPVGVPITAGATSSVSRGSASSSSSSSSSSATSEESAKLLKAEMQQLKTQLETVQAESDQYGKLATHASLLVDNVLFPPASATKNATADGGNDTSATSPAVVDVYTMLNEQGAWDETDLTTNQELSVLKVCALEMSMDYCKRLSTHETNDYIEVLDATTQVGVDLENYPTFAEMEQILKDRIAQAEPFCGIFDQCLTEEFQSEECRPKSCPFQQEVACRYLTACLDEAIQTEYAVALQFIAEGEPWPPVTPKTAAAAAADATDATTSAAAAAAAAAGMGIGAEEAAAAAAAAGGGGGGGWGVR
eukprot:CAMPEP_0195284888 /NCGR_PEP_ID=MMETSP0707-20130614/2924_1 /TAXON_ID=33640 /ORGANISM="Asterionellopsis glacialis, Strain CCMP134" /LENGTH=558 /DNA_ID=CAMNT_0040344295 /DNA_START=141 /DNA_END=1817 /DNA_ORIENTATION=-